MTQAEQTGDKEPIGVLVVDDSPLCRDLLMELLEGDPTIKVIGTAVDGRDAVEKVPQLRPDVVTMDLRMPVMDGIEATTAIMNECPTPILVLTGHPFQSGRNMTFEAIRAGARDLMIKPDLGNAAELDGLRDNLTRLIHFLAECGLPLPSEQKSEPEQAQDPAAREISVVAMASSAGGPGAVHSVLSGLPEDFPAGIVLVQHIAEGFASEFAAWLDAETPHTVRVAENSDFITPGQVLVAPSEAHLRVMPGGACRLIRGAPIGGYRPSADVLLSSVARVYGDSACGVILSGMGEDGVAGLSDIHAQGGLTLAQDQGSSVVHGMPGAAMAKDVVNLMLPVDDIAAAIVKRCSSVKP